MHAPHPSSRRAPAPWAAAGLPLLALLATASAAGFEGPELVSGAPADAPGNGTSQNGAVTPNGRFVAFESNSSNLVPGDANGAKDAFLRDRKRGTLALLSVDSGGSQGNGECYYPVPSASGRFVAFLSAASNLVPGDTNDEFDIFVHDAKTGETARVSTAGDGAEGNGGLGGYSPSISASGRLVAFDSRSSNLVPGDANGAADVFVKDRKTGTVTRVSVDSDGNQGNSDSFRPFLSANGRFVAFYSSATNLVPGDTNGAYDVFVHDLRTGTTTRVSVDSDGNEGNGESSEPVVTPNGRLVAFISGASNLVPGDTNGVSDAFVRDLRAGETRRVSVDSTGQQGDGGGQGSNEPKLPSSGKFVVFMSDATNLVPGDTNNTTDVFLHDLRTGGTRRLSVDAQGGQGNAGSGLSSASLSSNGRFLAFNSQSSNFAAGDTNGAPDVFLLDLR